MISTFRISLFVLLGISFYNGIISQRPDRRFPRFQRQMLNIHNQLRRQEVILTKRGGEIGITRMRKMKTSRALIELAKNWTSRCVWEHSPLQMRRNIPGIGYAGENLFTWFGWDASVRRIARYITSSWYDEKEFYDFETGDCEPGEMCGHYTQVVWGDSEYLGCAISYCSPMVISPNVTWERAYLVSCNYGPGGNIFGRQPYTKGQTCSDCDGQCRRRLCIK